MGRVVRSLKHGWNAFSKPPEAAYYSGSSTPPRHNRSPVRYYNRKSLVGSIYTRLAVDVSQMVFYHSKLDENDVAISMVRDSLNECLTLSPNIDQSAQAFKIDYAMTLFENGHAAIVPVEADLNPAISMSYNISQMRIAPIVDWRPRHVIVDLYDDREEDEEGRPINGGVTHQVPFEKRFVGVVENPFYGVMNEPSGPLQRLRAKLAAIDGIDEAATSGRLDLILQFPYALRGDALQARAKQRQSELTDQLKNDPLGIGYIDVNEKVIQLNRPVDNKLLEQVRDLQEEVFSELGLTREILNGTADRDTINSYFDRTIEPIANAAREEMTRKFLTKTARTQRHSITIYRDPLKVITIGDLAEVSDKLIRNRVIMPNEMRPKIGFRPIDDPAANQLVNPNMPDHDQTESADPASKPPPKEPEE